MQKNSDCNTLSKAIDFLNQWQNLVCKGSGLHKLSQNVGCWSSVSFAPAVIITAPLPTSFFCFLIRNSFGNSSPRLHNAYWKCYNSIKWLLSLFTWHTSQLLADNNSGWACALETYKMASSLSTHQAFWSLHALVRVHTCDVCCLTNDTETYLCQSDSW